MRGADCCAVWLPLDGARRQLSNTYARDFEMFCLQPAWLHTPAKAVRLFDSWLSVSAHCRDTALHFASSNGHTESVTALLGKGADVNAKNIYRKTAFHVAKDRRAYIAAVEVRCMPAIAA